MPSQSDRFYGVLGLAMRSGSVTSGEPGALLLIKKEEAGVVLIDADTAENTRKKLCDAARHHKVPVIETSGGRLGEAIGKQNRMCCAIKRGGLCGKLCQMASQGEIEGIIFKNSDPVRIVDIE